ncbi:MAG TPA: hypothetical protein VM261_14510, partial [Kofleriaceae bacterium]|nr:hypothetical protein [Kofleriaceae bacterium]
MLVSVLSVGTWAEIKADHHRVQLDWREDLNPGSGKPKYVREVLEALDDATIVALAHRCVGEFPERAAITLQN